MTEFAMIIGGERVRAAAQRAGRDAPVARAVRRGRAQHCGAVCVVQRHSRTCLSSATRDGRCRHAGGVVCTA